MDDKEYSARVALAVYEAVLVTSRGDADAALVKTGPAFDALMTVAILLVAGDPKFASPAHVHGFSDSVAAKLRQLIYETRQNPQRMAQLYGSMNAGKVN